MIRNLTIVAVASFVLAVGCLAGAAALGGRDLLRNSWNFPADWHVEINDGDDHISINPGQNVTDGETSERQIAWAGSEALQIDAPAEVIYTQAAPGAGAAIKVYGPRGLVDRVLVEDGRIHLRDDENDGGSHVEISGHRSVWINGRERRASRGELIIEVTAPAVRSFTLNGSGDLKLRAYDQPSVVLEINGSGDIEAQGKTAKVDLRLSGSGEADLTGLETGDAKVAVAGSGSARIAPRGAAQVEVAGSGDVSLTTKPASLVTNIAGSGEVNESW